MSDGTATMSVTAKGCSAQAISAQAILTNILAIDLGKFKSVACRYDPASGVHAFETIATTPSAVHDLLVAASPSVLVMEACNVCGWISDLAESMRSAPRCWRGQRHEGPRTDRPRAAGDPADAGHGHGRATA
jgi:hypothetical protein